MIRSQDTIRQIALRIDQAYSRRYSRWLLTGINPGVWESAAKRLLEVSVDRSGLPIDPELFVSVQRRSSMYPDPWSELTQQESLDRYRRALKRIIRQLRQELKREMVQVECRLLRGVAIDQAIETAGSKISPLASYILAHRAGREDLARKHFEAALNQHGSCPLYRLASRALLPVYAYPTIDRLVDIPNTTREIIAFSLN